jgi:hypothetical protein
VGTRIEDSTWRTSISMFIRITAMAAPGLAPWRRKFAHQRLCASSLIRLGAHVSIPTGPPHSRSMVSKIFSMSAGARPKGWSGAHARRAYEP